MGRVWLTSDLHFGHHFVSSIRGFDTPSQHDAALMDAWSERVDEKDSVWVLGDLAIANPTYSLALLETLPGRKHLIWGNHDQGHPMQRDAYRQAAKYLGVFASAQAFARRRISGTRKDVLLSHFPYAGDTDGRPGDRFGQYRLRDEGVPLIHGHTHSPSRWSRSARATAQAHVGVDAWGLAPVPLETVEEMFLRDGVLRSARKQPRR